MNRTMLFEGIGMPVVECGICKRRVLTHVRFDRDGALCRCCVECDARVDPVEVRWIDEAEFRLGASPVAAVDNGGCGSGGCGQGGCGRR